MTLKMIPPPWVCDTVAPRAALGILLSVEGTFRYCWRKTDSSITRDSFSADMNDFAEILADVALLGVSIEEPSATALKLKPEKNATTKVSVGIVKGTFKVCWSPIGTALDLIALPLKGVKALIRVAEHLGGRFIDEAIAGARELFETLVKLMAKTMDEGKARDWLEDFAENVLEGFLLNFDEVKEFIDSLEAKLQFCPIDYWKVEMRFIASTTGKLDPFISNATLGNQSFKAPRTRLAAGTKP
jgi:hypothetical protein